MTYCGKCHTCDSKLQQVLDGEEWCSKCKTYRRYRSHGWSRAAADSGSEACPEPAELVSLLHERRENDEGF